MAPPIVKAEIRFWAKVDKAAGCWLWTGGQLKDGYGAFRERTGCSTSAHRFSWKLHFGDIPEGKLVCHKCDTPLCIRPDHLFLGTPLENTADMIAKARHSYGTHRPEAKLDEKKVRLIRGMLAIGLKQTTIAILMFVDKTLISQVKRRIIWKHV